MYLLCIDNSRICGDARGGGGRGRRGLSIAVDSPARGVYFGGKRKERASPSIPTKKASSPGTGAAANKRARPTAVVVPHLLPNQFQPAAAAVGERAAPTEESSSSKPHPVVKTEVWICC